MQSILNKLYTHSSNTAVWDIIDTYQKEGSCIVNFIYFSNIVSQNLFCDKNKTEKEREYKKILLKSDYLLPDGIALQIFYACAKILHRIESTCTWLPNLNGTDFIPFFLSEIKKKFWPQKICLLLYWTKEEYLNITTEKLKYQWFNVIYKQDWYSDFERQKAQEKIEEYQDSINILLVARSTPKIPLQELRTSRNYQKIQQNKLLVINTWWLFDFIAWVQKRAPKLRRTMKLERLYRLISDPKRNTKKVTNSLALIPYIFHFLILWKFSKEKE